MECGGFLLSNGQRQRRFQRTFLGKCEKGYKVSGNRNPPSERFWSKSEEMWMGCGSPNDAEKLHRNKGWQLGRVRKGCREKEKSSEWTFEKIREAHEKVARGEIGLLIIVQKILRKSTDFLRRIIGPVGGMGGVTYDVILVPALQQFPLGGLHLVGFARNTETATRRRGTATGGARCVEATMNGEHPHRILVVRYISS